MRETALTRDPDDKRRLDLPGVGTIRFANRWGTELELSAPGHDPWRIKRPMFRGAMTITDPAGGTAATMDDGGVEHGGRKVRVDAPRQGLLERRPPFLLLEGDRELARIAPRVWDEKPVAVTLLDESFAEQEPLLLLLAFYRANLVASSRMASAAVSPGAVN